MRDKSNNAPLQNWGPTLGVHALPLRDYFAAQALSGLTADPNESPDDNETQEEYYEQTARAAYALADAMLKERDK